MCVYLILLLVYYVALIDTFEVYSNEKTSLQFSIVKL